jgi:hypothetical protein
LEFGVFTVFAALVKVCELGIPFRKSDVLDAKMLFAPFYALAVYWHKSHVTLESTKRILPFAVLRQDTLRALH